MSAGVPVNGIETPPPEPAVRPRRKGALLVVDDEEGPRQSLRVIFKDEYEVLLAEDGPTAIELAQNQLIDVAVVAIRMAGDSGNGGAGRVVVGRPPSIGSMMAGVCSS